MTLKIKATPSITVEIGENFAGLSFYGNDTDGSNYLAITHADNESFVLMSRYKHEDGTWDNTRQVFRGDFEYKDNYLAYAKIYSVGDLSVASDGRYDLGIVQFLTAPAEQYGPTFYDLSYKVKALLPEIPTYDYIRENSEFSTSKYLNGVQHTGSEFDVSGVERFVGMSVEELQGWSPEGYSSSSTSDSKVDTVSTEFITASTWSGDISINRELTGTSSSGILQAKQVEKDNWTGPTGSLITGSSGNDIIRGLAGWDILDGGAGDDLIHGGNGRDVITGGTGSDELHGDFGWNTYKDQRDGSVDLIAIKSDQFLSNWWYGKAGNSPNGEKSDIIEGLDSTDHIKIIGVASSDLSFRDGISHKGVTGIGIYAKGVLEALYTGGDLSVSQISSMTTGDNSAQAMANQLWSYNFGNTVPPLQA